ncbi:malonyl-CoA decarboxylase-domain-containing protein [Dunaliella salina]|uniref:Malonyl-CoA decarboxylase-domain-containing protein n=1 Tax=Dunaliella salina TaxID=3046 RepID=A0ABQ7FY62_DUNSA|nr:malonyl-CoA decarboxylase-domain-containing protein [Dunaliella salina]|eukprot:KAF5827300.1 malonyl-CoA decarboxylase-domain-containing protein [Dunaliella salina]
MLTALGRRGQAILSTFCWRGMASRRGSAQDLMILWEDMLGQAQKASLDQAQVENNLSEGRSSAASRARSLIQKSAMHIPQGDIPQQVHTSLVQCYNKLPSMASKIWLCQLLADELGTQRGAVDEAVKHWLALNQEPLNKQQQQAHVPAADAILRVAANLSVAAQPLYVRLFHAIAQEKGGICFLVRLRADVLDSLADQPAFRAPLRAFSENLRQALAAWFTPGLLALERVSWNSSAELLHKVMYNEAVHPMRGWEDLKRRLCEDRRVHVFFHPCLPGEPLVILHCALVNGEPCRDMHQLLGVQPPSRILGTAQSSGAPNATDTAQQQPSTAMFYSISTTQRGLAGIDLGKFLIKQVADSVKREFPSISTFATLSPVPGFRQWLLSRLLAEDLQHGDRSEEVSVLQQPAYPPFISKAEASELILSLQAMPSMNELLHPVNKVSCFTLLHTMLHDGIWMQPQCAHVHELFKHILMRNAARYLVLEKRRNLALDPVANFHFRNGAEIQSINWLSDTSEQGLARSFGICVNYVYKLERVYDNNRMYLVEHKIQASKEVAEWLRPTNG